MTKLTYQGPHDAVVVQNTDGEFVDVPRDGTVDVPADAARDFLAGGEWTGSGSEPEPDHEDDATEEAADDEEIDQ